ncbi:ubiquitin carboxyl-terminal hydrolase 8 [Exophiala viscosa]|uniref:ubiquitinyl hydrolase 1 n=1 Tax=Exophiala viscosa TaxID=2486360 RepID=A0AAN6I8D5_9EURO|nr:ubiquitin carboxyl-terminal hydrolase 8 [Exophiala viscosa]KAI1620363.1 ubiquitin carboxyl-terminal hydrolase 8 [Exophiala viscosa]
MALSMHMPAAGCEHMNNDAISRIRKFRSKHNHEDLVQYTCLECPAAGGFPTLDQHFSDSQHEFAVSQKSVYCGRCNDLVYDPTLLSNSKKRKLTEANDEDDSYLTANTSQRPCGRSGVRGLFNLGETCYMNAVLQMMVHNTLLASYFLGMGHPTHTCPISKEPDKKNNDSDSEDEDEEKKEQQTCVACGMTEVFSDVTMVDQPLPAHAVNLLFASWKNIPQMSGKGQQDAQEWFMCIIDRLHEAVAHYKTPEKTNSANAANGIPAIEKQCVCFFHKVFYGRYNSQITCDTCHTVSSREDEFSSISLDFKKQVKKKKKAAKDAANAAAGEGKEKDKEPLKIAIPSLHECLRSFTAPEPLSPEQYNCQECNDRRSASKQTRIRKLPAILCVHVKRFGMKQLGTGVYVPEKYEGRLDFNLHLDMAPYTTRPPTNGEDKEKYMYDLDCVVVHQGEHAQNGHYFAFCRQDTKWFRFDDEIVSATTTEDVMRQEAYLLFYSLRSLDKM